MRWLRAASLRIVNARCNRAFIDAITLSGSPACTQRAAFILAASFDLRHRTDRHHDKRALRAPGLEIISTGNRARSVAFSIFNPFIFGLVGNDHAPTHLYDTRAFSLLF